MKKKRIIGHLCAGLTIIVWGTTFLASKELLKVFTPVEILFMRFFIAYLCLFIIKPKLFKWTNLKTECLFLLASLSSITIYQYLENTSLKYTNASNVSIIIACAGFFTGIFAKIFLKEKSANLMFFIGFIVSLIGIVMVTFNGAINLSLNPKGDLMAIIASVLWAVYSIIIKKISNQGFDPVLLTRKVFFYGIITLIPICIISKADFTISHFQNIPNLGINILLILFLGILASAVCFSTWNVAVDYLGATTSGLYVYLNPVVTIIFAVILGFESFTLIGSIGALITIIGLYISSIKIRKPKGAVKK